LQLFLTFSLFFDISHQNHPKTASLFDGISHFLTTFRRFLTLFQRISATFSLRFRAKSAHLRNPLLQTKIIFFQRRYATHKPIIKPTIRHLADTGSL